MKWSMINEMYVQHKDRVFQSTRSVLNRYQDYVRTAHPEHKFYCKREQNIFYAKSFFKRWNGFQKTFLKNCSKNVGKVGGEHHRYLIEVD